MSDLRTALSGAHLYGILDMGYVKAERAESVTRDLLKGGVDLLQLRAKGWEQSAILELGKKIVPLCKEFGVPFVVNDFPMLAVELEADALGDVVADPDAAREVESEVDVIVGLASEHQRRSH